MRSVFVPVMRDEERRDAYGAFVTLFAFMTGFSLLETARDALFLASLPASRLAAAYLVIAVIALTLTRLDRVLFGRFAAGNELRFSLLLASAVTWVFSALAMTGDSRVFFALYIWTGVAATLVVVRFWTALGTRFSVEQAKRLFAFIGSGSVSGAIVGAFVARLLSEVGPPQTMLFFAAAAFLVSAWVSKAPTSETPAATSPPEPRQSLTPADVLKLVWSRPYLRRVAIVVLTATVTFTLVDFLFKSTVNRLVAPDNLGEMFASIYLGLHILSLVVQLTLVSRLVRRLGVNRAQAVMPSLLVVGASAFAVSGALGFALAVKVIDGGLRHSLYRTTIELFFVPVTGELRARIKAFIDVLGQRGGQALASLVILGLLGLGAGDVTIAVAVVVTSLLWLSLAIALRKHYLDVFRETLGEEITETRLRFPALDLASLETLLATLSDRNDRRVVAALDLLAEQGRTRVVPALILYHPSSTVVLRALQLFRSASRRDFLPIADRLASHPDEQIRAAVLPIRASVRPSAWHEALSDPSPVVRPSALVGLEASGLATAEQRAELEVIINHGSDAARSAVARALGGTRAPVRVGLLKRLAGAASLEVRRLSLEAMRASPDPELVDALIPLLADRELRSDVRACLVAIGPSALARLGRSLEDEGCDYAIRRRLPKTIGAFTSDEAASLLLGRLLEETDGLVRFKILSALGRMRSQHPELRLDESVLERAIDGTVVAATKLSRWRGALRKGVPESVPQATTTRAILLDLLRHKQLQAVERLFRLINLREPSDDLPRIFRGLQSSDALALASSRELVEHVLSGERKEMLLKLIDDLYSGAPRIEEGVQTYDQILPELLQCTSETLSALAAYHAGEAGEVQLLPQLERVRGHFSPRHTEVVEQAVARLSAAVEGKPHHAG